MTIKNKGLKMEEFKSQLAEQAALLLKNVIVAVNVAWATVMTGLLTFLDIISDKAGVIASLAGACLSVVLIYTTLKTFKHNSRLRKLEEEERLLTIKKLKEEGRIKG